MTARSGRRISPLLLAFVIALAITSFFVQDGAGAGETALASEGARAGESGCIGGDPTTAGVEICVPFCGSTSAGLILEQALEAPSTAGEAFEAVGPGMRGRICPPDHDPPKRLLLADL